VRRPTLVLAAAILLTSLAWSSSGLVTLVLITGAAILLLAAVRFPRKDPGGSTPPWAQVVRLVVVSVATLTALFILLFLLSRGSCPPGGCV
jgi:hypothetical protein